MNLSQPNFDSAAPTRFLLLCALVVLTFPATVLQISAQVKEENLAYADLLYSQKEYAKAARQYQIFIRENPTSPNVQSGWFRLGECYLQVGQVPDAKTTFDHIVKSFKGGAYVGSAAYRLAVLSFNDKDYPSAATQFGIAEKELTSAEAKHQARYYQARSLQFIRKFDESLALYDQVIRSNPDPKSNPFHERSLLESARIYFEKGDKNKAKELFGILAKTATTEAIREEAIVRGGLIASEAGQIAESEALLNQAFQFPDTSPWKSLAQVGAIFNAFTREDYNRVIAIYGSGALTTTIEEYRPKMLLIVGHSYRMKGDTANASKLYSLVEAKYPDTTEGMDAGYRKLQILHQEGSPTLPAGVDRYVSILKKKNPNDPYIDTANLMSAEFHFSQAEKATERKDSTAAKRSYLMAANAYGEVREDNIKEEFRPVRLYKQGWAFLEAGQLENGILAISRFIKRFPDSPLAASALAKRGTTYQTVEDFTFAQDDYQKIIDKYPSSPELELAMQQKALIFAHERNLPKMIDAYEQLLKRFPNTSGKAEATYWIGVGHFDLEDYAKAIPPLEMARRLNPEAFTNKASIRIILSHYQLEQLTELTEAARAYIQSGQNATPSDAEPKDKLIPIPKPVLEYLGRKLAKDHKDIDAEFFLTQLSTPDNPKETSALIWKVLAETRIILRKYEEAIVALDNYLAQVEEPGEKGYAYLERGKAQLALTKFDPARDSANECLRIVKQGALNANSRILLGDIAVAEGNLEEAAKEYLRVSQLFEDREITPIALTKAINVYISLGDQENASNLRDQLRSKFPDYRE